MQRPTLDARRRTFDHGERVQVRRRGHPRMPLRGTYVAAMVLFNRHEVPNAMFAIHDIHSLTPGGLYLFSSLLLDEPRIPGLCD